MASTSTFRTSTSELARRFGRGMPNLKDGRAAETTCIRKATSLGISVNKTLSESSGTVTVERTMAVYAVPLKAGVTREEYDTRLHELAGSGVRISERNGEQRVAVRCGIVA